MLINKRERVAASKLFHVHMHQQNGWSLNIRDVHCLAMTQARHVQTHSNEAAVLGRLFLHFIYQ